MNDTILYIALKTARVFMRPVPLKAWLFLARGGGRLYYYAAGKKNRKALAHLKIALGSYSQAQRKRILKGAYIRLAQNFAEALYLPFLNAGTIRKNVRIADERVLDEVRQARRPLIFLGAHAGSWELSNAACAGMFAAGSYVMLAQPQTRYKKCDSYLNAVRGAQGIRVIRVDELKALIQHMTPGHVLGTIADHGGRDGIAVEFFSKLAMTPVGSIRLAKKTGSQIVLAFMRRVRGPLHEILIRPYSLVTTADPAEDLKANLRNINKIFEDWITQYPEEYLWSYKRWKNSPQKNVLVLSDAKLGHVKQSWACVDVLATMGFEVKTQTIEVKYKAGAFRARYFALLSRILGPRGSLFLLPFFLEKNCYKKMMQGAYDMVVSAGASLSAVNQALAFENNARSVAIMRPGILPLSRFDLVIMPRHDRPPKKKNVLSVIGSINAVTPESVRIDFEKLLVTRPELRSFERSDRPKIGVLIGGDSKNYSFSEEMVDFFSGQLKKFLGDCAGSVFMTTSRRTPDAVVRILAAHFKDDAACKLFVHAGAFNPEGTVGGIFHVSDCLIVSGESISMVSEAVASGKPTIVFEPHCLVPDNKVAQFLNELDRGGQIYLVTCKVLYDKLCWVISKNPKNPALDTQRVVMEGLKGIV
jgi:lauroyl/myristoyl acyltransferase/mitochondrial fission protein ELM1